MHAGIYLITNTVNGKVYVGSSVDLSKRLANHVSDLQRGFHANAHLQSAWDRYGAASFSSDILEYCDEGDLAEREDWWMELLRSRCSGKGYNIRTAVRQSHSLETREKLRLAGLGQVQSEETREKRRQANLGRKRSMETRSCLSNSKAKEWFVTNPEGKTYRVRNLKSFCKENGLHEQKMGQVAVGKIAQHRGWSCRKIGRPYERLYVGGWNSKESINKRSNTNSKDWKVVDPDGNVHLVRNLAKFCKGHNLHYSGMRAVAIGVQNQHRGWYCKRVESDG